MWLAIVETNGIWLEAGMMKIVFPLAASFASKAGPGATNFGTWRCLSRLALAPSGLGRHGDRGHGRNGEHEPGRERQHALPHVVPLQS